MDTTTKAANPKCNHEAIRCGAEDGEFIGSQDFGFTLLVLINCRHCRTTVARPGIGPVTADDEAHDPCIECEVRHCAAIPTCPFECSQDHLAITEENEDSYFPFDVDAAKEFREWSREDM